MNTRHTSGRLDCAARAAFALACLALLYGAAPPEARAVSPCTVTAPNSATVPTINGTIGAGEWSDVTPLTSGDPCLIQMQDIVMPGATPVLSNIRVHVKRYMRAGQAHIGFLFEVPDQSSHGSCGMTTTCRGESIALQFDPNVSRGTGLAALVGHPSLQNDYQIIFNHTSAGAAVVTQTMTLMQRSAGPLCAPPEWEPFTVAAGQPQPSGVVTRGGTSVGPGYTAEIEVPLAFLGLPASPMPPDSTALGFAFGVVNSLGDNAPATCTSLVCDFFGVPFPDTMPMQDTAHPLSEPCNNGDWVVPDQWGTLTFGLAPQAVTVSRSPDYWANNGLVAFQCDSGTTNYTYYPTPPCKLRLVANVVNNGPATTRNLLFLWSPVGAGTPSSYSVVALVENVTIAAGTVGLPVTTPVSTPVWTGMPPNQMAHPCVRVYVLPSTYLPGFPRSSVLAVNDAGDVVTLQSVYGLSNSQWTQKNISRHDTRPDCPVPGCVAMNGPDWRDAGRDAIAELASVALPAGEPGAGEGLAPERPPLPVLHVKPDGAGLPPAPQTSERPPVVAKPGGTILMPSDEFRRFSRDNVIVQVRAYGHGRRGAGTRRFNFLENMGGVIQLFPVEMLRQQGTVPFGFNVTNDEREKTIFLVVDIFSPTGVTGVQVALDTGSRDYAPRENRVMRGQVTLPGPTTGDDFKRWGLSLHAGLSIPHGNFGASFNPGPNVGVDLEYRFNRRFSLEAVYTFNRFRGETFTFGGNTFTLSGTNIHNLSLNGKVYGSTSPVRPFFNFGGGVYVFDSATARGGLNVGGGLQFDLTPTVALDSMYNLHNVFTSGSNLRYSTVQGGVRFRF
jgi:opacity protein-like surface antigen